MLQALRGRSLETTGGRDWNLSVQDDVTHDREHVRDTSPFMTTYDRDVRLNVGQLRLSDW
jgi:hypothetical protein